MVAEMLALPGESYLAEQAGEGAADVDLIHSSREAVKKAVGQAAEQVLLARYKELASAEDYVPSGEQIAARALRNSCLDYLACANSAHLVLAREQLDSATNMTDRLAALKVLAFHGKEADWAEPMARFYSDWQQETLVVIQWLQVQAAMPDAGALERVRGLMEHPDFDMRNPNKVRSLIGGFAGLNPVNFHREDGAGYRLLGEVVGRLNSINPQVASRLLAPLTRWRYYAGRQELMRAELQRLADLDDLSPDVYEVVTKSLQ